MMQGQDKAICEMCLEYLTNECSSEEKLAFEHHLPECQECQAALKELNLVWEAIPEDMDPIELPKDMKQQVMDAVTRAPIAAPRDADQSHFVHRSTNLYKYWIAASAAIFALIVVGTIWFNSNTEQQVNGFVPIEQALSVSAAQIEMLMPLVAVSEVSVGSSQAYGVACIVNNGENRQFVVYVFNTKETVEQQAYQVWLIDNEERRSAGTFRVDEQGVGLLAMPISSNDFTFASIGISLEPDDKGDQPRGVKVFESTRY